MKGHARLGQTKGEERKEKRFLLYCYAASKLSAVDQGYRGTKKEERRKCVVKVSISVKRVLQRVKVKVKAKRKVKAKWKK